MIKAPRRFSKQQVKTVDDLSGFLRLVTEAVQDARDSRVWFRGVNHSHDILPRSYWSGVDEVDPVLQFSLRSYPLVSQEDRIGFDMPTFEGRWRRYIGAQHYGIPTRLVDWTENALVALYFAVSHGEMKKGDQPCVWVLNPHTLNVKSIGDSQVVVPAGDFSAHWLPKTRESEPGCVPTKPEQWEYQGKQYSNEQPIAIWAPPSNPRIVAQQGVFTAHGALKRPINGIADIDVWRIRIKKRAIQGMKAALAACGIREDILFPELDKLAKEISKEIYRKAKENRRTPKKPAKKKAIKKKR